MAAPASRRPAASLGSLTLGVGMIALAALIAARGWSDNRARTPASLAAARLRVAADPLDVTALTGLGLALDRSGAHGQAEDLIALAGRLSWRERAAHQWLLRSRLARSDYAGAAASADALLRTEIDPAVAEPVYAALIQAAQHPAAIAPLATHLADSPGWRASLLIRLAQNPNDLAPGEALLTRLRAGPTPPVDPELAPYVLRLVNERRYGEALALWRRVARAAQAADTPLHDGDFNGVSDGMAFTWSPGEGAGGFAAVAEAPGGRGEKALRVTYDGVSSPNLPRQLLVLAPGGYVVSWQTAVESGEAERLLWRLTCAEGGTPLSTGVAAATGGWRPDTLRFTVPDSGCTAQWLELSTDPGERRSDIVVWYDKFSLAGPL